MEKQPVIIKNNKYGLIVILDGDLEFEALQEKVAEKFRASAKFFGETQIALCFQGRKLSQEEEMALVETITGNCRLQVISIVDEDETTEQAMKKAVETQAEREGLMERTAPDRHGDAHWRLTARGIDVSNYVLAGFLF